MFLQNSGVQQPPPVTDTIKESHLVRIIQIPDVVTCSTTEYNIYAAVPNEKKIAGIQLT